MHKELYAALIMSLGVTAASSHAFGGAVAAHGVVSAPMHSTVHPSVARLPNHRHGRTAGNFFPATGGFFWDSQPDEGIAPPISGPVSGDINYTYKYDVPWDWAHRYPPGFFGSPPASPAPPVSYTPGCPAQTVTVPGADGKDQTVTVVRC
ncbi:MAG TPA: hypothetical protein VGM09_22180 [Bradyrhizobium sp.]